MKGIEDSYVRYLCKIHNITCDDIRVLGKEPFCWIFKYPKNEENVWYRSEEEKEDRDVFENLTHLGVKIFRVIGNGIGYSGFSVTFI